MQETQEPGSIPESGRSPGEEMATHSSIVAWKIPWSEEPGRLQPRGHKESDTTEHTHTHTHTHYPLESPALGSSKTGVEHSLILLDC